MKVAEAGCYGLREEPGDHFQAVTQYCTHCHQLLLELYSTASVTDNNVRHELALGMLGLHLSVVMVTLSVVV